MGGVGWMLLLLSQMMVPVASQKPPGLSVGVVMGQTRHVSDQLLRPPRRPDTALEISVVILKINQTDPKTVITQVRNVHIHPYCTHSVLSVLSTESSLTAECVFTVFQGV